MFSLIGLILIFSFLLFGLFELIVWLPMLQRRNNWVHDRQIELVDKCYDNASTVEEARAALKEYWTYGQMLSAFHIQDVEKMKGPFRKPWYIIGNIGVLGSTLK